MGCEHNQNQTGFTLVEISIVMIIIGLLIGGTFGGMKLIENMRVSRIVQDLKAIDSASLTFKDTYGRLPGDISNPSARLPDCTATPCATGGNGNRLIGAVNTISTATLVTDEKYTFWSHLHSANLLSMRYRNTTDMTFGEGLPKSPLGGGYRMVGYTTNGWWAQLTARGHLIMITPIPSAAITGTPTENNLSCLSTRSIDQKMDDDRPTTGRFVNRNCNTNRDDLNATWANLNGTSFAAYFPRF